MKKILQTVVAEQDALVDQITKNPESIEIGKFGNLNLSNSGSDIAEIKLASDAIRSFKEERDGLQGKIIVHKKFAQKIFDEFGIAVVSHQDLKETYTIPVPVSLEKMLSYPEKPGKERKAKFIGWMTFLSIMSLWFYRGNNFIGLEEMVISSFAVMVLGGFFSIFLYVFISPKEGFMNEKEQKKVLKQFFRNPPENIYELMFDEKIERNWWNKVTFKLFLPDHPEPEKLKPVFTQALKCDGQIVVIADKKAIGFQFDEERFKPFTDDPLFAIETDKYFILYPETAWGTTENEEKMVEEIKNFISDAKYSLFV